MPVLFVSCVALREPVRVEIPAGATPPPVVVAAVSPSPSPTPLLSRSEAACEAEVESLKRELSWMTRPCECEGSFTDY